MITLIILLATIFVIGLLVRDMVIREAEYLLFTLSALGVILFSFLLMLICYVSFQSSPVEYARTNHTNIIYSLKIENSISGQFSLGSGYVNGCEYYYSFVKIEDGGFDRLRLAASNCRLFLDGDNNQYVQWQKIYYRPSKWYNILPFIKLNYIEDSTYYIHVPKNTIIQKFEVR